MTEITKEEFLKMFEEFQNNALNLVKIKNNDYGFSFTTDGFEGVIVRLTDKLNRLRTLSTNNEQKVDDENIKDTLIDLQNYTIIANICLEKDIHSPLLNKH